MRFFDGTGHKLAAAFGGAAYPWQTARQLWLARLRPFYDQRALKNPGESILRLVVFKKEAMNQSCFSREG